MIRTILLGALAAVVAMWGTAFAAAVMGEQLGWDAVLGAVLILSGCVYSNLGVEGIQAIFQKHNETRHFGGGILPPSAPHHGNIHTYRHTHRQTDGREMRVRTLASRLPR